MAGNFHWPLHPILDGVSAFSFGDKGVLLEYFIGGGEKYYPGSYSVFQWNATGYHGPIVSVRDKVGPKQISLVHLGFFPVPREDSGFSNGYYWSDAVGGNLKKILIQSLAY